MTRRLVPFGLMLALAAVAVLAASAPVKPVAVKVAGAINHDAELLADGKFVEAGSEWDGPGCVWWTETDVALAFDLGKLYRLHEILLQVDNNDTYRLEYSVDGQSYTVLFTVVDDAGTVESGMDSFSSDAAHAAFAPSIEFKPVKARYIRLQAVSGDDAYSAAELQAFGEPVETAAGKPAVKAVGTVTNSPTLLVDGQLTEEGAAWQDERTVRWEDNAVFFVLDFGEVRPISDLLIQVDDNDDYAVDGSVDGQRYERLFLIRRDIGDVSPGMDTMTTAHGKPSYEPSIDFKPVKARYLKVYAVDGDGMYAIAEIQFR